MTYRGYPMWPPIWVGVGATRGKNPEGEAGRLVTLRRYPNKPQRIFFVMEYEGDQYTGCLLFDNNALCDQAYDFLMTAYPQTGAEGTVEVGAIEAPQAEGIVCRQVRREYRHRTVLRTGLGTICRPKGVCYYLS